MPYMSIGVDSVMPMEMQPLRIFTSCPVCICAICVCPELEALNTWTVLEVYAHCQMKCQPCCGQVP